MKKKILTFILGMFLLPTITFAASASASVPGSVTNGSSVKFTVNLNNTAAWNIRLSGSGATSGCSQSFADVTANGNNTSKSLSVTCKATSEGTITFTATGDITDANGSNSGVSLTRTVQVTKPRDKEPEARLSSLEVKGYKINFNKDTYEYSITVEPSVSSIEISAKSISKYASVSGTGNKEVDQAGSIFEIVSVSETGDKKVYKINVSVIDNNPIKVKLDKEYNVVKSNKLLTAPSNTQESTVKIEDFDIPCYINEKLKLTIVGLKDQDGKIYYAVYGNGKYQLYNENPSKSLLLYIVSKDIKDYDKVKTKINEQEYETYKIDDRFVIVYAMNLEDGKYNYYKYDTKDKTFQYFELKEESVVKEKNIYMITTIILSILLLVVTIICILIILKHKKARK